jgi:hypothetical protein
VKFIPALLVRSRDLMQGMPDLGGGSLLLSVAINSMDIIVKLRKT